MKTKKTNREKDLQVIQSGNMEEIEAAIREFAFDQETQILLIKNPALHPVLNLYMSIRKLGKQPITHLLSTPRGKYDESLVKTAVIGNVLSEANEKLLLVSYPELAELYLQNNPNGNYFSTKNVEDTAKEVGLSALVQKYPRPHYCKPCTASLGAFFTPEMRAKLSL